MTNPTPNPDELPDHWRPVEVARTVLDAPPVPYEIVDTASGEVVQAGELPADHPVIQALEQDPATYTGAAMVSWPDARLDLS